MSTFSAYTSSLKSLQCALKQHCQGEYRDFFLPVGKKIEQEGRMFFVRRRSLVSFQPNRWRPRPEHAVALGP
jgi:hypothetical protein